ATYFAVSGPGNAAKFTGSGNIGLRGGGFSFCYLTVASGAIDTLLDIGSGPSVTVGIGGTASASSKPIMVSGAGAALTIPDGLNVSGKLSASNGGNVSLGGLNFGGFGTVSVDSTTTMEIGLGGGAPPEVGAITIDHGASVTLPG